MPETAQPQLALDEKVFDDGVIEAALEERLGRRLVLADARADAKKADAAAMVAIERLELPEDGVARVGRFRITRRTTPAKSVSFETEAKSRVSIAVLGDDD